MNTQLTPIAFSGDIPQHYDSGLGPMFFEPFALDMAHRLADSGALDVLELAAGTGRLTRLLPTVMSEARIIASDINPAMVLFGQDKTRHTKIQWLELDAVSLPFADATFDLHIAQFGVMFYSDKVRAFREAYRILRPGGTMMFSAWDHISGNPMAAIAHHTLEHFFPENTPAFYSVPFSYYNEDEIRQHLSEAGFQNSAIELVTLQGYSATARDAARGLIQGTPTVTAIEDRDPKVLPELLNYLEHQITEIFGSTNLNIPLRARVVTALKA